MRSSLFRSSYSLLARLGCLTLAGFLVTLLVLGGGWLGLFMTGFGVRPPMVARPTPVDQPTAKLSVQRTTIQQVFAAAQAYVQTQADVKHLTFQCGIDEGIYCWLAAEGLPPSNPSVIPRELARQIVKEIDAHYIEHMQANTITIHCQRPVSHPAVITCEYHGGGDWRPLPVH